MDSFPAPGGAAEPQGQVVQGGGQLTGVPAAGKPGQDPGFFLPDMLVVAGGLVDVEQEDKVEGLIQMGLLASTLEQLRGQQLQLDVMLTSRLDHVCTLKR